MTSTQVGTPDGVGNERASGEAPPLATASDRSRRWAFWSFVAYVALALPTLMWIGSYRWFFGDEWAFLTDRSVTVDGLFRPHNGQHWATLPVLAYRAMYSLVGLHDYRPYQLMVVVLHLTTAVLMRVIIRRAGVRPWLATVVAAGFVLLGPAEDNILWAFQIGFVGVLVFGFSQLILVDHEGPVDRRDWLALGFGLLALMTHGPAPALIVAAGLVCVLRRRYAAAALQTVPLAVVFVVWAALENLQAVNHVDGRTFTVGDYLRWMQSAVTGLFLALGHFALVGVLLAAVVVVGAVVGARTEGPGAFVRRAAVPLSMVVSSVIIMSVTGPSRFTGGADAARAGRYIGLMAALVLPALAVAADALVRRWSQLYVPVLLLLLLPIPFNAFGFRSDPILTASFYQTLRANTVGLAQLPVTRQVPRWVQPNDTLLGQPGMSVGWLLDAEADGKLPPAQDMTPVGRSTVPVQLGVALTGEAVPETASCTSSREPVRVDPSRGDRLLFGTEVGVATQGDDGKPSSPWVQLKAGVAEITLPDLHLLVGPKLGADTFDLCS